MFCVEQLDDLSRVGNPDVDPQDRGGPARQSRASTSRSTSRSVSSASIRSLEGCPARRSGSRPPVSSCAPALPPSPRARAGKGRGSKRRRLSACASPRDLTGPPLGPALSLSLLLACAPPPPAQAPPPQPRPRPKPRPARTLPCEWIERVEVRKATRRFGGVQGGASEAGRWRSAVTRRTQRQAGTTRTPEDEYAPAKPRRDSRFHFFSSSTPPHARRSRQDSSRPRPPRTYGGDLKAHGRFVLPPERRAWRASSACVGGPPLKRRFEHLNWTNGCVDDDEQIDSWLRARRREALQSRSRP